MLLDEFFNYKNQLMNDLISNDEIVRLMHDDYKTISDPASLIYTQIFPYEHLPETAEHGLTYICCDVDIRKSLNKTFLLPTLSIWVFTHYSKMRLPKGGVRVDQLCAEIAEQINGSRYYGLGELTLYSVDRFSPMSDFQGKEMIFNTTDFNRTTPTGQGVPSNRKRG